MSQLPDPNAIPNLPITRIVNPYKDFAQLMRVQCDISSSDYFYLFNGVLAGCRGAQSKILGTLLQKLINELKRNNTPQHYDPDNESRVANLVSGCTFGRIAGDSVARTASRKGKGVYSTDKDAKGKPTDVKGEANRGKRRNREEGEKGKEESGVGNG